MRHFIPLYRGWLFPHNDRGETVGFIEVSEKAIDDVREVLEEDGCELVVSSDSESSCKYYILVPKSEAEKLRESRVKS